MADEYSKYKLFRKYKTEDGVNYTPLDEYQALYESGDNKYCDCGYYTLSSTTRTFNCVNGNEYMTINSVNCKTLYYMDDVHWTGSIYKNYEPLISDYTIIITDYNKDKYIKNEELLYKCKDLILELDDKIHPLAELLRSDYYEN